ncbi:MAG: oligosaccharide flippase family protein, partial [Candidatus Cloacimonetes bacterium]|nr:oligosaccharide flippase family protein [Candidatus Cloacimonadota bacterium]
MELPLIGILINSVNSILLPNLSGRDPAGLTTLYRASVRKNAIIVFPLATVFFLFATEFMIFVYGTVYASAALYFRIYLLILPLRVATYGIVFQAMGKTRLVMIDSIIMLLLNAILNYFFIRLYGMKGAALATVVVSWLIVIVYLWQMRYSLQLKLLELFPPISLALNLVAAILPVLIIIPLSGMIDTPFLRMILGGPGYLVLYLILAYILRVIKDYDIRMLGEFLQGLIRRGNR